MFIGKLDKNLFRKGLFCWSGILLLSLFPASGFSSPNYYYSAVNYEEYQSRDKLEEKELSKKVEAFLQTKVPGLSVSYRDVIDALIAEGHHVFIRGGVTRDLLSITKAQPNDVDLDYTGEVEDLLALCQRRKWQYTHFPGRKIVVIGDHRSGSIDAVPVKRSGGASGDANLEFTINNIIYHCNSRSFLRGSESGIQDLKYDRLRIASDDWNAWLYQYKHPYYKIFRFWKMVGKGYVYSSRLYSFFREETVKILRADREGFEKDLTHYLSGHFYSFQDVSNGAVAVMGYEWAQEHVMSRREEMSSIHELLDAEKDRNTFHP